MKLLSFVQEKDLITDRDARKQLDFATGLWEGEELKKDRNIDTHYKSIFDVLICAIVCYKMLEHDETLRNDEKYKADISVSRAKGEYFLSFISRTIRMISKRSAGSIQTSTD